MATTTEDNNDNDVAVGSLPATFSDRLFDGLGLNPAFPLANGAATKTVGTLSGGSTLVGFVADLGGASPSTPVQTRHKRYWPIRLFL